MPEKTFSSSPLISPFIFIGGILSMAQIIISDIVSLRERRVIIKFHLNMCEKANVHD